MNKPLDPAEIERNLIAFYLMNGTISGAKIHQGKHIYIIEKGPNDWPNFVLNKEVGKDNVTLRLEEVRKIDHSVKNHVFTLEEAKLNKDVIKRHHLVPVKVWNSMDIGLLSAYEEKTLDDFETIEVKTVDELEEFMSLVNLYLYKKKVLTLETFKDVLNDENCCLIVGKIKGKAVSTAMSYQSGPSTGIYYITTKEEFRKKGYGMETTARLMNTQLKKGFQHFVLHATPLGVNIYLKLGFTTRGKLNIFTSVK